MTKIKNFVFGIGNRVTNTINYINREAFNVSDEWIDELYKKHYTKDIASKYIPELFEEQSIVKNQLEFIFYYDDFKSKFLNEIRILKDWLNSFKTEYANLKIVFDQERIVVNENSKQHLQLENLNSKIKSLLKEIDLLSAILKTGDFEGIKSTQKINNKDLEHPENFGARNFSQYSYIDKLPTQEYDVLIVFRRLSEIINQIPILNFQLDKLNRRQFLIHGYAGMGKSNLTAHITNTLKDNGGKVIFISAKSFSGESTDFEKLLLKELDTPEGYRLKEILKKLNTFGKKEKQDITIVLDALNETTFSGIGFSDIWKLHIDNFLNLLTNYPFIKLITTFRTSYIDRIWSSNKPSSLIQITGFNNSNLESVIEKYFSYFNIITEEEITNSDIFYFRTPLMLDLYCKMINTDRETPVVALLGIKGYSQVFEKYINDLALKIKLDLGLASIDVVTNGIKRTSNAFLENLQAQLSLADYYSKTENKPIEDINVNSSFSNAILEEYLIYIRDAIHGLPEDVVLHTQQEVGGYLLAKELLETHTTIENVVNSDFYQNNLVGNNLHQLKDDILNFLIVLSIDRDDFITKYSMHDELQTQLWKKLQIEPASEANDTFRNDLLNKVEYQSELSVFLYNSRSSFLLEDSSINILSILPILKFLEGMQFDLVWTKFIYENWFNWDSYLDTFLEDINVLNPEEEIKKCDILRLELAIWLLETTIRELRDKATSVILEFSSKKPQYIFDKVYEFSSINRLYIYERIVSICYGVCLRKQNEDDFINGVFREQISKIYSLQFGDEPTAPKYNYIVIDSIKHMTDLAILKEIFDLNADKLEQLKGYKFNPVEEWIEPEEDDINAVRNISNSWTLDSNPDPLRGDFVHYTIPRLTDRDGPINRTNVTANIYKRIIGLGYEPSESFEAEDNQEKSFYYGEEPYGIESKVDRLGKKYSWIAFFDYAGYLLLTEQLDVWYQRNEDVSKEYKRLGDVDIEVSNPRPILYDLKLFDFNLLEHKDEDPKWTEKKLYNDTKQIWEHKFEEGHFTLLKGYLEQKPDASYDVRSYLLIDSFLVKKEDIHEHEHKIINRDYDWHNNLHGEGSLSNVYFGELYWSDNIPETYKDYESLPTDEEKVVEHTISLSEVLGSSKYGRSDLGKTIKNKTNVRISFRAESTIIDYLWESKSKVFPSQSRNIPSSNLGRHLGLKADALNFQILDKNCKIAFKSIDYIEDDIIKQELDYLRTDLLNKYMDDNGLVLLYQIKQFAYDRLTGDGSGDYRGMQFLFPHLDNN